jgi:formylglycine-generating enzyme required for sulfatase activity
MQIANCVKIKFLLYFFSFLSITPSQRAEGASELSGPGNQYAVIGGETVFEVTHALDGAVTYQWQVSTDGGNMFEDFADSAVFVGSQTAALRISNVQAYLFGTLYRVIAEVNGSVYTSEAGELLQAFVPSFTQQPVRNFDAEGVLISAAVTGPPDPILQWQISVDAGENWADLVESASTVGVDSVSLRISTYDATSATYRYRLKASNLAGEVFSEAVVLGTVPELTEQPLSLSCVEGDVVSLSIAADGFPAPSIRWEVSADNGMTWVVLANDTNYGGVDTETLTIATAWDLDALRFRAVAVNVFDEVISNAATLSVAHAPRIVSPPVAMRVFVGRNTQFSAIVSANPVASYQWQISYEGSIFFNLQSDAVYLGESSSLLGISGATMEMDGDWLRLRATNSLGTTTSTPVQLTVRELQTYENWLAANSIPETEREPDMRHGPLLLSNREAYVFGLDPFSATAADLPQLLDAGGSGMLFYYRRNIDVDDTAVFFQSSIDLNTWDKIEPIEESVRWYADGVEGREALFDWDASIPQFIRMQAGFVYEINMLLMATIPAGSFQMGDVFTEGQSHELPVHTVNLSAYRIGETEVTWAQWQEVRDWAVNNGYTDLAGVGDGKGLDHPVYNVSWYDAVKWCNAASEKVGFEPVYLLSDGGAVYRTGEEAPFTDYSKSGYRLPTEAEWERAARGGLEGKRFPWGDTISHAEANYRANGNAYSYDVSGYKNYTYHPDYDEGGFPYTSPVGSFVANGYGLYDMAGNVWEWCGDWYGSGYYGSSAASDPTGPDSGSFRVIRGGDWLNRAIICRVTSRSINVPSIRDNNIGFRLARRL